MMALYAVKQRFGKKPARTSLPMCPARVSSKAVTRPIQSPRVERCKSFPSRA